MEGCRYTDSRCPDIGCFHGASLCKDYRRKENYNGKRYYQNQLKGI